MSFSWVIATDDAGRRSCCRRDPADRPDRGRLWCPDARRADFRSSLRHWRYRRHARPPPPPGTLGIKAYGAAIALAGCVTVYGFGDGKDAGRGVMPVS